MCRETYSSYESNVLTVYPLDKLQLAADLYHIDITTLLDEYNLFLYHGQGSRLKTIRTSLHMTQSDFAAHIGVPIGTLKNWEKERVRMSKSNYEKLRQFITL